MNDRSWFGGESRPDPRGEARPGPGGRRRGPRRPSVERLEGRALLSVGGSPDFGYAGGRVNFHNPSTTMTAESLLAGEALQADGKDVVVGYLHYYNAAIFNTSIQDIISVARLNADGIPDATFGTMGSVNLQGPNSAVGLDHGVAAAIQADGKIVVVGNLNSPGTPQQIALYRLNADGTPDASFGTAGAVDLQFQVNGSGSGSVATSLAIQADGKILVGGDAVAGSPTFATYIARLNPSGTPDATFGASGQVQLNAPSGPLLHLQDVLGLTVQADQKIDYATTVTPTSGAGSQIVVGRLNLDGSFDTSFGGSGQVTLPTFHDTASGLAIQADGKLVVAGAYFNAVGPTSTTHFDVYRLAANGAVDATFGTMGEATPASYTHTEVTGVTGDVDQAFVNSLAIQPDGKILVGGTVSFGNTTFYTSPTVVRLDAAGVGDPTFGAGGQLGLSSGISGGYSPYNSVLHSIYSLAIQPDGKILAVSSVVMDRLLSFGSSNDFNEDGTTDPAILLTGFSYPIFAYRPSSGGPDVLEAFGTPGAGQTLPAPGAYDGSGIDELGVYLPSLGAFGIRPYSGGTTNDRIIPLGLKGAGQSIPAPADYTGSGHTELGVYEPSLGAFVYQPGPAYPGGAEVTVPFGTPGAGNSIPVPADYDGSGHDEVAVYLPAIGAFAYRPAGGGADVTIPFGTPGVGDSIPVPGDYDGSGHTELGVYLPKLGAFAYRPYGGGPDRIIGFGTPGSGNSIPMPGDYDGSGHTELGVYLPAIGAFAYRPSAGGADVIVPFGVPGTGKSIPFSAIAPTAINGGTGGGGGHGGSAFHPAVSSGYLDFVPDLAGHPKKKADPASPPTEVPGQP